MTTPAPAAARSRARSARTRSGSRSPVSRPPPIGWTVKSRAKLRSIWSRDRAEEARREDAVDHEHRQPDRQRRRGRGGAQRVAGAESTASRPPVGEQPPQRARRAARSTGMIRNGAAIAMPANIAIVMPMPSDRRQRRRRCCRRRTRSARRRCSPGRNSASADERARARRAAPRRRRPPSTARIGAMRPARRAGPSAADERSRASPSDDRGHDRAARDLTVADRASRSPCIARPARARARSRARARATVPATPIDERLDEHGARRSCARVAPSVRSMPSSRIRCSTVMLKLLRIRKPPTNSATPGEEVEDDVQRRRAARSTSSLDALAASAPATPAPSRALQPPAQRARPSLAVAGARR